MHNEEHQKLIETIEHTHFHPNPNAGDGSVHPLETPTIQEAPKDPVQALSLFYEEVKNCTESDYGDFMRKVNLYMNDLAESLRTNKAGMEKLNAMKTYTQYTPNWNTEATKQRLLCDILVLRDLVAGLQPYPEPSIGDLPV